MDYVTSTSVSTVPGMTDLDSYPAFESTGSMIQCEIAALAQPQASDSASNLRFPSENIDHHAFPGKLPSSFLSNTFSSAENNAHSSSHRESHTTRHPGLRKQLTDPAMKLVYLTYLYLDHKPYCIIDRTWFATVVYSIVNRSTVDTVASECLDNLYDIPIDVITSLQSMPVLVILEAKPEENLARMQRRGSNIDCNLPLDYIIKQNIAFRVFANAFHWETMTRFEDETPEMFQDRCVMRLKKNQVNIDPILRQLAVEKKLY